MKTISILRTLALVVAAVTLTAAGRIAAQEASPASQPITDTVLGTGMPSDAPGKVLRLERVTLEPGAAFPTHVHPGAYLISVESGDFGFTLIRGAAEITHAGSTTAEPIKAGAEVVGHPGDAIFENGGVVHSARNAGTEPAVVLATALLTADQPVMQPTNDQGTPTS